LWREICPAQAQAGSEVLHQTQRKGLRAMQKDSLSGTPPQTPIEKNVRILRHSVPNQEGLAAILR
jgi:hypothetical protein